MLPRSIRLTLALLLAAVPVLAGEPNPRPSLESLEAALFASATAPLSSATLGTCRVTCRPIGGGTSVQYQWLTTYADCCDPAIQQCDSGYRALGLSFNGAKCFWTF